MVVTAGTGRSVRIISNLMTLMYSPMLRLLVVFDAKGFELEDGAMSDRFCWVTKS